MKIDLPLLLYEAPVKPAVDAPLEDRIIYKVARRIYERTRCAEAQNWKCGSCGNHMIETPQRKNSVTLEHVIPKAVGGLDSWENFAATCLRCNNRDGDKMTEVRFTCLEIMQAWD